MRMKVDVLSEENVTRVVLECMDYLGLGAWDCYVIREEGEGSDGEWASVAPATLIETATIKYYPKSIERSFPSLTEEDVRRIFMHEALHVLFADASIHVEWNKQAFEYFEKAIDRLARLLAYETIVS